MTVYMIGKEIRSALRVTSRGCGKVRMLGDGLSELICLKLGVRLQYKTIIL